MPSLADREKVDENYLSAINEHNVEKSILFYAENLENKYHGAILVRGNDQLRTFYEKCIVNPEYLVQLFEYLPVDGDNHIHVHLQTSDGNRLDIPYFFKENPERFTKEFTL